LETWTPESLAHFTNGIADRESLKNQAIQRSASFDPAMRQTLYEALISQYAKAGSTIPENLDQLLDPRSVTVTTGHQLSLALGPLFTVFKILHVVQLCEAMNESGAANTFLPVFWLASEDHDLEEVQNVHVFNKSFTWVPNEAGPVGSMTTAQLGTCYDEILACFQGKSALELSELFQINATNYAQHYHQMLSKIFGKFGVILIDGNDPTLKKAFSPLVRKELHEQFVMTTVSATNAELVDAGKKVQAHVRPINLFYLSPQKRERIVPDEGHFVVGEQRWTLENMLTEVEKHPERFSPNVLMRPLYQETVLPNVCYVGGSGELNYWTQLKSTFKEAGLPFPLLKTRISGFLLKGSSFENNESSFRPFKEQEDSILSISSNRDTFFENLDQRLTSLKELLITGSQPFGQEAEKWALPQIKNMEAALEHYKARWQKQEKQNLESQLSRERRKYAEKYPNDLPQERVTSLFQYCGEQSPSALILALKNLIDPFSEELHIFTQTHETE
ncbi:MAG: bacillithiol biosynthesis cysteine-adding enzyme BshC, partial [Flavobacteriia bacterium]|nr:bacillithiol biosynthesis cysteine-adding enzyme BshC [Flavobacteriia bacterium]